MSHCLFHIAITSACNCFSRRKNNHTSYSVHLLQLAPISTMAPQAKKTIAFDRQSSSMSYLTSSTVSSSSSCTSSLSSKTSPISLASLINFTLSLVVYWVFIYGTKTFVPSHDDVYEREHPYQTTSSGDTILNFEWNHPLVHPASVPSKLSRCYVCVLYVYYVFFFPHPYTSRTASLLFRTCVHIPALLLFLIHMRSSWNCALASISGLLTAMGICEVSTHIIKYYVLRRRPNFYAHCGWDSDTNQCTAMPKKILEAQLSFPSGHSSLSWCGMTFLVLVMLGKMQLSMAQHSWWKRWAIWLLCWIPWSWSAYVSTSRIVDRWHHISDVVAGTLLGILCATISYHSLFPHIFSMDAGVSHAELSFQKNH